MRKGRGTHGSESKAEEFRRCPFIHWIHVAMGANWHLASGDTDLVSIIQWEIVRLWPEFAEDRGFGKIVPYTRVVMGFYELLTRTYLDDDDRHMIYWTLEHCTNHEFTAFLRLTNPRHNPNQETRQWAMLKLVEIAKGQRSQPGDSSPRLHWRRGARMRVEQLKKSGALAAHGIYPELVGV